MKQPIAWAGLDVHARTCLLAWRDHEGRRQQHWQFPTAEPQLIKHLQKINATEIYLSLEECGMSRWLAEIAIPLVHEVVVCDPKENHAIAKSHHKCDIEDAYTLAHLHRLGALKKVWQPASAARAVFKSAVQAYLESVRQHVRCQLQLKARYRQWGVIPLSTEVYTSAGRDRWLGQIAAAAIREQLREQYALLDFHHDAMARHRRRMVELGRAFPEIARLRDIPGVGPIGAHVFVGFIQDPGRFERPQQLYRYCRLGIRERSSDGKPLGHQQLDRNGHGALKAVSYRAWMTAMRQRCGPVFDFYERSCQRSANPMHARLNTQRKVLNTMRCLWQQQASFDAQRFLGEEASTTAKVKCD